MNGPPGGWRYPDADSTWSVKKPRNEEMPAHVPLRPQGDVPVIAHLVWEDREELLPGRAVRWTQSHVMVALIEPGATPGSRENHVWLRASDVFRTLPRRPRPVRLPASDASTVRDRAGNDRSGRRRA
ncbi:hypothetical protein [Cellulosimicrobium cellulans]|uniref:hypothetical protein n=1 Tax=Cellulosimicrobium cellulans TaxID=1710 RepID=UPI0018DED16E|nr:hypothetical protein [Cellulosimicrobium cellulans]